jgi:SAM-dependent methyltransferase
MMKDGLPRSWPVLQAYHHAREDLFRRIISDDAWAPDALILDAGCGDGFYSRLLAAVVGPEALVVAVDTNLALLGSPPLATKGVERCLTDVERAGLRPHSFDAVWLCRSLHSAKDPQERVTALAAMLRPGGRLVVIENDLADRPIAAGPPGFDDRVQHAMDRWLEQRCGDGASMERYRPLPHLSTWMERAGLQDIVLRTYAVEDVAPMTADVETYWRRWTRWRGEMIRPFLSDADRQTYWLIFDPASPEYRLARPGVHCREPLTVARGIAR